MIYARQGSIIPISSTLSALSVINNTHARQLCVEKSIQKWYILMPTGSTRYTNFYEARYEYNGGLFEYGPHEEFDAPVARNRVELDRTEPDWGLGCLRTQQRKIASRTWK